MTGPINYSEIKSSTANASSDDKSFMEVREYQVPVADWVNKKKLNIASLNLNIETGKKLAITFNVIFADDKFKTYIIQDVSQDTCDYLKIFFEITEYEKIDGTAIICSFVVLNYLKIKIDTKTGEDAESENEVFLRIGNISIMNFTSYVEQELQSKKISPDIEVLPDIFEQFKKDFLKLNSEPIQFHPKMKISNAPVFNDESFSITYNNQTASFGSNRTPYFLAKEFCKRIILSGSIDTAVDVDELKDYFKDNEIEKSSKQQLSILFNKVTIEINKIALINNNLFRLRTSSTENHSGKNKQK